MTDKTMRLNIVHYVDGERKVIGYTDYYLDEITGEPMLFNCVLTNLME